MKKRLPPTENQTSSTENPNLSVLPTLFREAWCRNTTAVKEGVFPGDSEWDKNTNRVVKGYANTKHRKVTSTLGPFI